MNLFIYGSLRDPAIFRSVCGLSFTLKPSQASPDVLWGELAILPGYRRVSPDNVYWYAVPDQNAKIEGILIHDVPPQAMADLDAYEGKYYERESVQTNTASGLVEAQAYLAMPRTMRRRFGDRFHVNLIHELWLRRRIERFFETHTRPGESGPDVDTERRARRELLGTTERDLVVSHLGRDMVSDYYLEHELDRPCPGIRNLNGDPQAQPFLPKYLALVVKQVLCNQLERLIYERYRYEIERICPSRRFFTRTVSLMLALRMINLNSGSVDMVMERALETLPPDGGFDLIDYVKYAVSAADNLFDTRVARHELERVRANRQPGLVPMGAELELSNLGYRAVEKQYAYVDRDFDGFAYFQDFALDVLTWKLGGYVDDHSGESRPRQRGFLELAPGRLSITGEVSKPASPDPWVLNQLIREITEFYPVQPHSLHLSFQLRRCDKREPKVLPLEFVKCLLALGGGTTRAARGNLWVSRMGHDEIRQFTAGEELVFARRGKRRFYLLDDDASQDTPRPQAWVQQYKFIRLERRANYEPLIMALKGLQLAYNAGDYLTAAQLAAQRRLRDQYEQLKNWSYHPEPVSPRTIGRLLDAVRKGLLSEGHRRAAHQLHYVDWALGAIEVQLRMFNKELERAGGSVQIGPYPIGQPADV